MGVEGFAQGTPEARGRNPGAWAQQTRGPVAEFPLDSVDGTESGQYSVPYYWQPNFSGSHFQRLAAHRATVLVVRHGTNLMGFWNPEYQALPDRSPWPISEGC